MFEYLPVESQLTSPELGRYQTFGLQVFDHRVYGDNVFEKCGINRDETGDIGKTRYFSGKRQHLRRERPAVYQQS